MLQLNRVSNNKVLIHFNGCCQPIRGNKMSKFKVGNEICRFRFLLKKFTFNRVSKTEANKKSA